MMTDKPKSLIVRLTPELHQKAKVLSAQTGEPLQRVLERLLREWTAEQERKEKEAAK